MKKNLTGYPSIDKTHLKNTSFFERNPIIPSMSISDVMNALWAFSPNDYAITCGNLRVSHLELLKDAKIVAKSLMELGVKKGDIICVSMPNYYQAFAVFVAANRIGAITTYLNPFSKEDELIYQLNKYESPILVNYDKTSEYNNSLKSKTKLRNIITLQKGKESSNFLTSVSDKLMGYSDFIDYSDLGMVANFYKKISKRITSGKDDALILFTSGSTGNPKDMLFTNKNLLSAAIYYKNSAHLEKLSPNNKRWLGVVPFMYPYGFAASVLSTLLAGKEAILAPDIGPHNVNEYLKMNPNLIFGSPAFLELIKRNIDPNLDCSSLEMFVSGGDFLSESQSRSGIEFFKEHNANVEICNGSGNGELLGCCTNAMNVDYRPDTVGKLVNGPKFIIINEETGEEVKYNEIGVLCVLGENVFKGYYKNPQMTEETMINYKGKKYYKTGNVGFLSEDGYFTLVGRASRFFIVNTLNKVYCELIQNVISSIDIVESCAVVPKPNDVQLFESKAYIVLKPGIVESDDVIEYIKEKAFSPYIDSYGNSVTLKDYEAPKSITILDRLPRTPGADKIDYEYLKKDAEKEYADEKNNIKLSLKI